MAQSGRTRLAFNQREIIESILVLLLIDGNQ
jgi:hypothetical protein